MYSIFLNYIDFVRYAQLFYIDSVQA